MQKIAPVETDKREVAHHEDAVGEADIKNLPGILADEETARYLDSSVVIDAATNKRVKRMVCSRPNKSS